nr:biopolymer transporter ExbD [Thiorhodovibrio winogradskyi]
MRPLPPQPPELNLTPLVDVVFLLLLFFMISTTFEQARELPIALPEADGQPAEQTEKEPLVVSIDRDSHYFIAEQPLELATDQAASDETMTEQLTQALREAAESAQSESLLIEADAQTPHQAVMRVLDAAQQLGLTQLAFAAVHSPGSAEVGKTTAPEPSNSRQESPSARPEEMAGESPPRPQ